MILPFLTEGLIPAGAKVLFGGKALTNHSIPSVYGAIEPTAVFVPIKEMLKPENFPLATTEVFGPFQVGAWVHGYIRKDDFNSIS